MPAFSMPGALLAPIQAFTASVNATTFGSDAGAAVVVNDLGSNLAGDSSAESPAADVAAKIVAAGGRAVADQHSVSGWKGAAAIVETAVSAFGRLDIVVNNAGITRDRTLASATEEDFDLTIAVHLKGTYAMCHHAAVYWRAESKAGRPVSGRNASCSTPAWTWARHGSSR